VAPFEAAHFANYARYAQSVPYALALNESSAYVLLEEPFSSALLPQPGFLHRPGLHACSINSEAAGLPNWQPLKRNKEDH